jgi:phosphohistidine phosphatase SixA
MRAGDGSQRWCSQQKNNIDIMVMQVVLVSPLTRTLQTAEEVFEPLLTKEVCRH